MPRDNEQKNPVAEGIASLVNELSSVKGGRLVLALALGVLSVVPVAGAVAAAAVEYKNLYAEAEVNGQLGELRARIDELGNKLRDHASQLNLLFDLIVEISTSLKDYLGSAALSKVEEMDSVAGSTLAPPSNAASYTPSPELESLVEEKDFDNLLAILDGLPETSSDRARRLRTKALYGLHRYTDLYALIIKEPLSSLTQEELEALIWSCFEIGYTPDGTKAFRYHEEHHRSTTAHFFRLSVKSRFARKVQPLQERRST